MRNTWGITPEQLRRKLQRDEWDRADRLRARLRGARKFPIKVSLKPPTAAQALADLAHFRDYVQAWAAWDGPGHLCVAVRKFPQLGQQRLPTHFQLDDMSALATFLGGQAQQQWLRWQGALQPILAWDAKRADTLWQRLDWLEALTPERAEKLVVTLRQLTAGMGQGQYLRSLPLRGVDTKFVEEHLPLLAALHENGGTTSNSSGLTPEGLLNWLDCSPAPAGWLHVRPLDTELVRQMGGIGLCRIPADELQVHELPGSRVLLVENVGPAYSLPTLPGTVAICGFGANLRWTTASWLKNRQLGYWGDLDTWGLHYLSEVRRRQPHVTALMMDYRTLRRFQTGMSITAAPNPSTPAHLSESEQEIYRDLLSERYGGRGLEQERISQDYAVAALQKWTHSNWA